MKLFFRGAALAPLLALVAGCCANNSCACNDLYADSLFFLLKGAPDPSIPADTSYFTSAQLDTVYLRRANPTTPTTFSDPVSIVQAQQTVLNSALAATLAKAGLPSNTLIISNNSPFSPSTTGGKLSAYNYRLTVQDKSGKSRRAYVFDITNIQLKGQYNADGCCTCYQNTAKSFQLNGRLPARDVTETDAKPLATTLSKSEAK